MERIKGFSRRLKSEKNKQLPSADQSVSDQGLSDNHGISSPQYPLGSGSTSSDLAQSFPDGIKVWHPCPSATIDICFIHGLTGNRDSTWTASNQSLPWPTLLLPSKLPSARLLTWGYDAYVVRPTSVASKNRLIDHASNLLIDLTIERATDDTSRRPLIFVVHSLGGLVCKEAILSSRNHPESHLRTVFDHTLGIVFMGTPHQGSWMAKWMEIPASGLGVLKSTNKSLLQILATDNQLLESIQVRFWQMIRELRESGRRLEITCFFEELALPVVGQVVSKDSATLEGYTSVSVHANHRDMVRFKTADETGFKRLLGDLLRWERQTREGQVGIGDKEASTGGTAGAVSAIRQPCYLIPFRKNQKFVGRVEILDEIKEKYFGPKECHKVAIVGLGGIGKTQVALNFAYWVKANKPEYSIFWVPALSKANFEQAYVEMANELGVARKNEDEDIKELVRRYLCSERAGNWLLVVDNADDRNLLLGSTDNTGLNKFLPESESGLVLFTTRSREVAVDVAGPHTLDLEKMSPVEAITFLNYSLYEEQLNTKETTEIVQELEYLPLAISQAAAYLNKNQMSIRKYLGLLQSTEQDLVSLMSREFYDNTRYKDSKNAVATTWLVSFDHISKSDNVAASLLKFISCIESKAIPQSILPKAQSKEEIENAIGTLCGYAFLARRDDNEIFDMHSLVHMATRLWLRNKGQLEQTTSDAVLHLNKIFPSSEPINRNKWREYMPHAVQALKGSIRCQVDERYDLFFIVGRCLSKDRRFKEAIRCFEENFEWRKQCPEENHSRLASEYELASAYLDDRRVKKAIEILEHIVTVRQETSPEEDHFRLDSEHQLASAYLDDRRVKKAIEILEHIVTVRQKTLPEEDHSRLDSEHQLASAYLNDRRIRKAIEMFEHIVAVQKTLPEEDHSRLTSEHELARAYLKDRRVKKAIEMLENIVTVRQKTLPEEDHSRLNSEHQLASAYLDDGRVKKAIEMFEHIVVVEKTLPEEDHSRLVSEHELARAYLKDRRVKKAIDMFEHIIVVEKTLPEEDNFRLASEHELASAYLDNGRVKEAIEMLEHIVAVKETLPEKDHSRLASEHALARAYLDDKRVEEAIEMLEHIVAVDKKLFVEDDPDRLASLNLLKRAQEKLRAGSIAN